MTANPTEDVTMTWSDDGQAEVASAPPGYLSVADAAEWLGISRQAVIARIHRGTLLAVKQRAGGSAGWRYLVRGSDIGQ